MQDPFFFKWRIVVRSHIKGRNRHPTCSSTANMEIYLRISIYVSISTRDRVIKQFRIIVYILSEQYHLPKCKNKSSVLSSGNPKSMHSDMYFTYEI